jgi:hypothetical protein
MNNERGAEFFLLGYLDNLRPISQRIIAGDLSRIDNKTSRKLLIELSKKYKSIKKFL